jgi:hypothetical protein
MYQSDHPLSRLIAARLLLQMNEQGGVLGTDAKVTVQELNRFASASSNAALNAAIQTAVPAYHPESTFALRSVQHLNWSLLFAAFGSAWGYGRWAISGRMGGLSGSQLWKFVSKKSRTGRYVFFLLSLDLIAESLMAWPEEGVHFPLIDQTVKVSVAKPNEKFNLYRSPRNLSINLLPQLFPLEKPSYSLPQLCMLSAAKDTSFSLWL